MQIYTSTNIVIKKTSCPCCQRKTSGALTPIYNYNRFWRIYSGSRNSKGALLENNGSSSMLVTF